ncbi:hypothetical protein C8R45DRAFT_1143768 [Mycena sanguinolenta]|nr:hypothetical protein C8R45DRAFT_1143768 [Mycena sanguinolenta]
MSLNIHPIALIGGLALSPNSRGEGNILPGSFVYGLGARGVAVGAGSVGGGNTVHQDKWSFGDTSAVPIIGIEQFCTDYQLPDDVHTSGKNAKTTSRLVASVAGVTPHLRHFGIPIANTLFRLKDEDLLVLQQSGLKPGHRASLQAALENLVVLQQSGLKRGPLLPGVLTTLQPLLVGLGRVVGGILAGLGLFGL